MSIKRNLDVNEMKKIAHEIIEEESKKYNFKINCLPLTFLEYYNNYISGKKFKLFRIFRYKMIDGFNDLNGNAVIFIDKINKIENIEGKIFRLAEICYHEARHTIQQTFNAYSYDCFFAQIEFYIRSVTLDVDYKFFHDKYSFEIGANLYSVSKAKEYLKNRYPSLYEEEKDRIEKLEKRYNYDYLIYDAADTFERFIQIRKNVINKCDFRLRDVSPVLEIFMNEDNTFKEVSQIINNDKFKLIDSKIVSAFFSCKSFLESVDMEKLSDEELDIINNSLQYTNKVYQNQTKLIEKTYKEKAITFLEYLKSEKSLMSKIKFIDRYFTKLLIGKTNLVRDEKKRMDHMKDIPKYLEKSKSRSKGYLAFDIFYIIGLLISILTILYLFM